MDSKVTVEGLLESLGGCGPFQWLITVLLNLSCATAAWNIVFMSFGSFNPGWTCQDEFMTFNMSSTSIHDHVTEPNPTEKESSSCDAFTRCHNVVFNNHSSTIVTQWSLMCDRNWILSMIMSLHGAGNLIGALIAGHVNHYLGRKGSHYGTLLINCILNVIAIFANDWPMYAAIRFMLGISTVSIYMSGYVYPVEFMTSKWRGIFTIFPVTNLGFLSFAVAAYHLRDWRQLHLASALFSFVWFLPVFWVPESLHWLTIKGKTLKAHRVGMKIAKVNRTCVPSIELVSTIADREQKQRPKNTIYTILDLYFHGYLFRTFTITVIWTVMTLMYFTVFYGIKNISGDIYTNLMIFSFITTVSYPFVPILSNTVGRRWASIIFFILCAVCYVGLICVRLLDVYVNKDLAVMLLSLLLITCCDGGWSTIVLSTVEIYPTALRSLGFSNASCLSRIGGMIAPFLIPEHGDSDNVVHSVMTVVTVLICFLIFLLPETRGKPMADTMKNLNEKQDHTQDTETEIL